MAVSEYLLDLIKHRALVAKCMLIASNELNKRAIHHDDSKFSPEEYDAYEEAFPNLQKYKYGTEEFRAELRKIKPAIQHHYEANRHHPEYFKSGINGMNLLDVLEMVCDWIGASQRNGSKDDIHKSLRIKKERFGIDEQLFKMIERTIVDLLWLDEEA